MSKNLSSRDEDQLRLLSIFHYVLGALQVLVALFPAVDLTMGMGVVSGRFGEVAEPASYGWTLIGTSVLALILGLGLSVLTIMAGRRLAEHRAHSFCLVVAAVNCFFFPFGTILGVLTLIVLKRPAVREAFGATTYDPNVATWEDRPLP
jgi:Fe2+ transport system protein B